MNIKEIARRAGVSVATVSRVLNHPESVAPGTKDRILNVNGRIGIHSELVRKRVKLQ